MPDTNPPSVETATAATFDGLLAGPATLVVAYFWGPDCPNCDVFAADLPEILARAPRGLRFLKVNAYEEVELARRFGLFGVPAFVLFRGGKKLGMMRQYYGREYLSRVLAEQAGAEDAPGAP